MTIKGNFIPSGICDSVLPCSDAIAISLIVDGLRANAISSPLIGVRRWRIVVGPLLGCEQLSVKDHPIACSILRRK